MLRRLIGFHFEYEVISWHHFNGRSAENILPAILVTTTNPHNFRESESAHLNGASTADISNY